MPVRAILGILCFCAIVFSAGLVRAEPSPGGDAIDSATVERFSQKFLGWHYWPEYVVRPKPGIAGFDAVHMTDCPTVFQLPGDTKWYMTFIGFDGRGYQSFLAESDDLVRWKQLGLAMGYGPKDEFDHGGVVLGAYLYQSYDLDAPLRAALQVRRPPRRARQDLRPQNHPGPQPAEPNVLHVLQRRRPPGPRHRPADEQTDQPQRQVNSPRRY